MEKNNSGILKKASFEVASPSKYEKKISFNVAIPPSKYEKKINFKVTAPSEKEKEKRKKTYELSDSLFLTHLL